MKKSEALTMPIGRAMDRAVFEYVWGVDPMNARQGHLPDGDLEYHLGYPVGHGVAPAFSAPGGASEDLIEKLQSQGWDIRAHFSWITGNAMCQVNICLFQKARIGSACSPTQREALCRAVLWAFADEETNPPNQPRPIAL